MHHGLSIQRTLTSPEHCLHSVLKQQCTPAWDSTVSPQLLYVIVYNPVSMSLFIIAYIVMVEFSRKNKYASKHIKQDELTNEDKRLLFCQNIFKLTQL